MGSVASPPNVQYLQCCIASSIMEKIFALWSLLNTSAITSCVLVLGYLVGGSPAAFGQQYPFIPVPGSPKGVSSLFEDSKGRLWLGGRQSACFDGARFFPLSDYGLPAAMRNAHACGGPI